MNLSFLRLDLVSNEQRKDYSFFYFSSFPETEKKDVKSPNLIEPAKEEVETVFPSQKSPRHDKETHGTSDDIDASTPVDEVKGPSFFHRMKEEIEAVVGSVFPKK